MEEHRVGDVYRGDRNVVVVPRLHDSHERHHHAFLGLLRLGFADEEEQLLLHVDAGNQQLLVVLAVDDQHQVGCAPHAAELAGEGQVDRARFSMTAEAGCELTDGLIDGQRDACPVGHFAGSGLGQEGGVVAPFEHFFEIDDELHARCDPSETAEVVVCGAGRSAFRAPVQALHEVSPDCSKG